MPTPPRLIQQHFRTSDGTYMSTPEALQEAQGRILDAEMILRSVVDHARKTMTWEEIGQVLGTSRQAAWERWH